MERIEFFARCAALEDLAYRRTSGRTAYVRATVARYLVFMGVAAVIAAYGVIYDNGILSVGAMAVALDLLPIASDWRRDRLAPRPAGLAGRRDASMRAMPADRAIKNVELLTVVSGSSAPASTLKLGESRSGRSSRAANTPATTCRTPRSSQSDDARLATDGWNFADLPSKGENRGDRARVQAPEFHGEIIAELERLKACPR